MFGQLWKNRRTQIPILDIAYMAFSSTVPRSNQKNWWAKRGLLQDCSSNSLAKWELWWLSNFNAWISWGRKQARESGDNCRNFSVANHLTRVSGKLFRITCMKDLIANEDRYELSTALSCRQVQLFQTKKNPLVHWLIFTKICSLKVGFPPLLWKKKNYIWIF